MANICSRLVQCELFDVGLPTPNQRSLTQRGNITNSVTLYLENKEDLRTVQMSEREKFKIESA